MTRSELDGIIRERYGVSGERLFAKYPGFSVYRHTIGRKWFAVIMELPGEKFGKFGKRINVVNLKVDPHLCDLLRMARGFFPAYHMNKQNWITAEIDEHTDTEQLLGLLSMSYRLTKTKADFLSEND